MSNLETNAINSILELGKKRAFYRSAGYEMDPHLKIPRIYIGPFGSDTNLGTKEKPVGTTEQVVEIGKILGQKVCGYVLHGIHRRDAFTFGAPVEEAIRAFSIQECNTTPNSYYAPEDSEPVTVSRTQMKRAKKENGRGK